jgi:hypothetical protein
VKPHQQKLFAQIASQQPDPAGVPATDVAASVARWLAADTGVCQGAERRQLDALCRQIDVRKTIGPVSPMVGSGLAAVLLANGSAAVIDDTGWALKCVNSALKVIDLLPGLPHRPALQAWAAEILDLATLAQTS